jgi:PilZ domain.
MMELLERRKEARYLCYGQVRMNRIPGVVRSGRIVDLSCGGCLIEMRLPIYVSQGSAIELAVQTRGIALRMQGKVAFVDRARPGQVGISFERLSERSRVQLSELVAELGLTPARNRNRLPLRRRRIW